MRIENNGVRYFSLQEYAEASNIKTEKKRNSEQLNAKRSKFLGECRVCKQPLSYIKGTNVIACTNPECRGVKRTRKDSEGNDVAYYTPVSRILDDKNFSYAQYLFEEV